MLKHIVSEGAFYAKGLNETEALAKTNGQSLGLLSRSTIDKFLKDEGYFASLSASKRLKVASHTFDLGEYLRDLHRAENLNTDFGPVPEKMAYYPPCHLREQNVGEPFADLLSLAPGLSIERIEGAFHCCGISGIMGFKSDFYQTSIEMGKHLIQKITSINPERLVTDCLSCRIQFNQLIPYRVFHPVEVLCESYANYRCL
jgi:glycerol-3-phosphate dehydrogenase subunit C